MSMRNLNLNLRAVRVTVREREILMMKSRPLNLKVRKILTMRMRGGRKRRQKPDKYLIQ